MSCFFTRGVQLFAIIAGCLTVLSSAPARAQLRYMATADLREQYNSSVFAPGEESGGWDLITEIEPSLRLYYNRSRSLITLNASFMLQVFGRMRDDADRPLTGYASRLDLTWSYLLSERTELGLFNRFLQGTENITVGGASSQEGGYQIPRLTTGSKFITNTLGFGLQHAISETWATGPRVTATLTRPYDQIEAPDVQRRGTSLEVTAANRIGRAFMNHMLFMEAEATYLWLEGDETRGAAPTDPITVRPSLSTMLFTALFGWRWQLTPMWDLQLAGGGNMRYMQQYDPSSDPADPSTSFEESPAPVVEAFVRYRRAMNMTLRLDYGHGWAFMPELEGSGVVEADTVGITWSWRLTDWRFDASGFFRYLRNTAQAVGVPDEETGTKAIRGEAEISYLLFPGLSLESSYQVEAIIDPPDVVQGQPAIETVRHIVLLGVSLVWPPPPPQDIRLNRRESEYEPVFTRGGGSSGAASGAAGGVGIDGDGFRFQGQEDDPADPNSPSHPDNPNNPRDPNDRHRSVRRR